jgi:Rps23 Pro-64 3,4-dihydroxylase Tpa1-like proline 4-hydroxylase
LTKTSRTVGHETAEDGKRLTVHGEDYMIRNDIDWRGLASDYASAQPFPHVVIDDFFDPAIAKALEKDVPDFTDKGWMEYNSAIEKKRALNHWDRFPLTTYRAFSYLNLDFITNLKLLTGINDLCADIGLHGGGWHVHGRGEKLNVHLDYSIHPKMQLERRLNLIVYLTTGWQASWGGGLGLWTHDPERRKPKELVTTMDCAHNRAVIFDTTYNSWHGLPDALQCPEGIYRKSMAVYYLTPRRIGVPDRGKALFAPHQEQENDPKVLDLIRRRANTVDAASAYKD